MEDLKRKMKLQLRKIKERRTDYSDDEYSSSDLITSTTNRDCDRAIFLEVKDSNNWDQFSFGTNEIYYGSGDLNDYQLYSSSNRENSPPELSYRSERDFDNTAKFKNFSPRGSEPLGVLHENIEEDQEDLDGFSSERQSYPIPHDSSDKENCSSIQNSTKKRQLEAIEIKPNLTRDSSIPRHLQLQITKLNQSSKESYARLADLYEILNDFEKTKQTEEDLAKPGEDMAEELGDIANKCITHKNSISHLLFRIKVFSQSIQYIKRQHSD